MVQVLGKEQQHQDHCQGTDDREQSGLGAGPRGHGGPRKRAADRKGAEKAAGDIG